jgi:GABA(A) receptor-associated protein
MKCQPEEAPFYVRVRQSQEIINKYPGRIPIKIKKSDLSNLPDLKKHKFLAYRTMIFGEFIYVIRKHIKVESHQAIFFFANNVLPPTSQYMGEIFDEHRCADGFLHLEYSGENVFG